MTHCTNRAGARLRGKALDSKKNQEHTDKARNHTSHSLQNTMKSKISCAIKNGKQQETKTNQSENLQATKQR